MSKIQCLDMYTNKLMKEYVCITVLIFTNKMDIYFENFIKK